MRERARRFLAVILTAFSTLSLSAMNYGSATVNGKTCDTVTWTDANGKQRSVALVRSNGDVNGYKGGYIERYTYFIGNTQVTGASHNAAQEFVSGLGCAVNHHAGASSSKANTANAASSFLFQGANHCVWRFSGDFSGEGKTIKLVIDYFFREGCNDFLWAVSYDSSALQNKAIAWDARGPYLQFDWNNDGNFYNTPISGIKWGDKYKFRTVNYVYNNPATTTWDYSQPNTIPYCSIYKNAANGDTEVSFVQTQSWTTQDAGGYWWNTNWGKTGTGMPENWNCPYQLNAYENYSGEKMAWGTPFGFVGDNAYDVLGYERKAVGYPHQGYAVHILFNQTAQNGTDALIGSMETVLRTTLTASTGTVTTSGPDHAGINNTATYQPAGWNHVYGAWSVNANASNQVALNFNISSGTLARPTLQVRNYNAATTPQSVSLNSAALVAGTDYTASVDATNKILYLTLNRNLTGNANALSINTGSNPPPPPPPPAGAPKKLFLFAGQSNMVGAGTDATQLSAQQQQPLANVKIYTADLAHDPTKGVAVNGPYWLPPNGTFQNYIAGGQNNAGNWWKGQSPGDWWQVKAFGPEYATGRDIAVALNETVLLAKYCVSATTLSGNWNPSNANPGGDAEYTLSLYNSMKAWATQALAEARKTNPDVQIAGFFWMQGEGDAFQPAAGNYQANLTAFIQRIRNDFGAELPFVFGRISNSSIWTDRAVLRAGQAAVDAADAKAVMVDTDDLPIAADQAHYTSAGTVTLGERFAAAWLNLQQPPPPPPPGGDNGGGGNNGGAQVPPAFQSQPSATPPSATVNFPVVFAAVAIDANNDVLNYTWDFGVFGTQTGAAVTQSFPAPGIYTATLTVSDGHGNTITGNVSVTIVAAAGSGDSDGDGASDEQEILDGTDPEDPASVKLWPLTVLKAQGSMQFTRSGRDAVSLSGMILALPAGFDPVGIEAKLNVGGATETFVLDSKGRGKSNSSSFNLSLKPSKKDKATKKMVFLGGDVAFKAKLNKGDWSDDWRDEGADASFNGAKPMALDFRLTLGGKLYGITVYASYSGKSGKGGKFKSSK